MHHAKVLQTIYFLHTQKMNTAETTRVGLNAIVLSFRTSLHNAKPNRFMRVHHEYGVRVGCLWHDCYALRGLRTSWCLRIDQRYASEASCRARIAVLWKRKSVLKSWAISRTRRWKGNLRINKSVLFWYLRISRSATVPGR